MSEALDRFSDQRRDLCRSDDLCSENSQLAVGFDSGAEFSVFLLKSLDAFEHVARSALDAPAVATLQDAGVSASRLPTPPEFNPCQIDARVHQIGPKQNEFFRFYAEKVLPRFNVNAESSKARRTGSKRKNRRADRSGETSQTQEGENARDNSARQEDRAMTKLETLDNLVKICVDSAERYRRAAADVGKEKLVLFFNQQEAARRRQADELNIERKRLGGEGEESGKESGSVGGFIDRTAMDLSVVMSMGDTGVVEWCRQDAKDVIAEYGKAPKQEFPPTTRSTLERQLAENLATLAALEKVLKPYGHPRS